MGGAGVGGKPPAAHGGPAPAGVLACTAGSVVPATRGRCEHAWRGSGSPRPRGGFVTAAAPAPLLLAWPALSSREAAL